MRIIDPHVHMYSRTTDDYEQMALCGIEVLVEPAFWLGNDRKRAGSFLDYFDHLSHWEPGRAAKRGIKHFCTLGINPKEAENLALAEEVLQELESGDYFRRPTVVGIGEIGLNNLTQNEETLFVKQLELARRLRLPVIVHTPHNNKLTGTLRLLELLQEVGNDPQTVDVDHNTEETIKQVLNGGYFAGITMYPRTKCSPQRARDMLDRFGTERIIINSSADWEWSDPLAVPKCAHLMRQTGFSREAVHQVVWETPRTFLARAENFKKALPELEGQPEAAGAS